MLPQASMSSDAKSCFSHCPYPSILNFERCGRNQGNTTPKGLADRSVTSSNRVVGMSGDDEFVMVPSSIKFMIALASTVDACALLVLLLIVLCSASGHREDMCV